MPYLESALVTTAAAGAMASIGGGRARFYLYLGWAGHSERLARRQTDHSLLVLNHGLHIVDSIAWRNVKSDGLARMSVDEILHSTTETKYQVNSGLLLNVVVTQGSAVCQLRAGKKSNAAGLGEYPPCLGQQPACRRPHQLGSNHVVLFKTTPLPPM